MAPDPLHDPLPIPSPDNLQIWLTRETKHLPSDLRQTAKEILALRSLAHHLRDLALRENHDWKPYRHALFHLIQILHEANSAREQLLKVGVDLHDLWTQDAKPSPSCAAASPSSPSPSRPEV